MTIAEIIAASDRIGRLLLIGGHAVIAHGHARTTIDLDLLVRRADRGTWASGLAALGYESRHSHDNFEQFHSTKGDIDLDLMFVGDATFDRMYLAGIEKSFGSISARVPSLEHLIALKLHVLKQNLTHRVLGDFDDVIQLVLVNGIDLAQPGWREIFLKFGNEEIYHKIRDATQSE